MRELYIVQPGSHDEVPEYSGDDRDGTLCLFPSIPRSAPALASLLFVLTSSTQESGFAASRELCASNCPVNIHNTQVVGYDVEAGRGAANRCIVEVPITPVVHLQATLFACLIS